MFPLELPSNSVPFDFTEFVGFETFIHALTMPPTVRTINRGRNLQEMTDLSAE